MNTNNTLVPYSWWAQNEATDPPGCLLSGPDAFEPEREALREMGAPDVDQIVFHDIFPEDRDSATVTADVTPALRDWIREQLD